MPQWNKNQARSGATRIFHKMPGYAILASVWIFISHFAFDVLLGSNPLHERYETIADALVAVPTTLIVFLLLRRELLRKLQVEKDRAASELRFAHVLENANDAIIGIDQDQQIFLFNRGAELAFGYPRGEVCGRPIQALLPSESAGLFRQEIQDQAAVKAQTGPAGRQRETSARRKDGTVFPAEISLSLLEEKGQTLLTVVLRDITHSKAAADALRRSHAELESRVQERTSELHEEREKLSHILDALPDGIALIGKTGRIEYLNPALERDFGPVAARTCHEYLNEQPNECADCPAGNGKVHRIDSAEWHSSRNDKTYERIRVPVLSSSGRTARLEILHDVTKRRAAEKERERLRAEIDAHRRLFQTIVQNATVSIAVYDGARLRLKWANPSYREILDERFREMDLTGMQFEEIIPRAAERGLTNLFRSVAESGQPYHNPEFEYAGFKRGTTYWQWSLLPIPAAGQDKPDLLLLAVEITAAVRERKRVEELRAEAEQRAEELRLAHGQLERRTRELSALVDLSQQVILTLDLQERCARVLEQLQVTFDCEGAAILVQDQGKMITVAHRGSRAEERPFRISESLRHALTFEGALNGREPLIVPDLWAEVGVAEQPRKTADESTPRPLPVSRSWMIVPMLVKDRVIGLLQLEHSQPGRFSQQHARLGLAMANHAAIAIENAQLYREARKVAALEERQRLARELHDSVSQALYAVALQTHTAKEVLGRDSGRLEEILDGILALAESAVSEMRFLIFELRPDYLENESLSTTLVRLADAVRGRYGCDVRLEPFPETDFPLDLKECLYRICHEALINTGRHARARAATVRIGEEKGQVALVVEDDGIGFETGGSFPGHLGLKSMQERAAQLGGILEIESGAGTGTLVRARFPLAASRSEAQR